ncbi:MAG: hypothetical protein BWY76_00717 [bacterium ADurb.Bin429]|nr:MAG: hypothetical protein BWY76_00717 [bacterium ADurb.Bin429]
MTLIFIEEDGIETIADAPPQNPFILPYSWGVAVFAHVVEIWRRYGRVTQTVALLTVQLAAIAMEPK